MDYKLKQALENPDALVFMLYKGIEAAMNALEEYKISENILPKTEEIARKGMASLIEEMKRKYIEKLSFKEKLFIKVVMSIPWSEVVKPLYESLLDLGKKEDGSYKTTGETIKDHLKKVVGSDVVGLFDGEYKGT